MTIEIKETYTRKNDSGFPLSEAASPSESPPSFNIDGTHKCSSVAAFQSLRLELTRERKVSVEGARWESRFRCREGEPMHSYRV